MSDLRIKLLFVLCVLGLSSASAGDKPQFHVSHTVLRLDIRDFTHHILKGKATLSIHSDVDGMTSVPLNLLCMNVDSVWVDGVACTASYNDSVVAVPLAVPLHAGDSVSVTVSYHGKPHVERFGGFGFYDKERMAHNMGVSFKEHPHNYGKSWYPCIDNFTLRSTFEGYYQTTLDRKAVGNGLLMGCDTVTTCVVDGCATDSSLVWHWMMKQPIPDYLCNVAVADYRLVHYEYNNGKRVIPIDAYVTPDEVEGAKAAYAIVPKVLAVMEKHFGDYVWDRVGYVSVCSPSGAMEHATNISMPRHPKGEGRYVEVLIHELCHHWFGDFVTCKTAGDMWLNEGITSYMVEVVGEELFGKAELADYRAQLDSWMQSTPVGSAKYHPIANTPLKYTYDDIVYYKGGWVMRQLRRKLGDELFFKAMRQYVTDFAFRNASTEDFKASLEKTTGKNLTSFFNKYIYK